MKEQEIDRIATMIYEAPLGEYIGRDGAAILAEHAAEARLLKGDEFLYRRGDVTSSFYIVTDGRLALVREKTNERTAPIVHVLEKGDLVGELGFIDQTPHSLSVRALGDAAVLSFSAESIKPLITEHPELIFNFMRAVIKRVHHVVVTVGEHERELQEYISTGGRGRG
ncbi:Cyclic nucleotide-binding domain-containing protein (plasmid) [Cupriavidus necator H16]|uniref:Cyclic nucleotide-binding domain-containing protein n=2 Tax=Cupriavidus necator TaxID=106590 RepID=Q79IN9_CUPNH|nr:cyclic nucleotide-binding domain-containing protein [Cupriavidus necator]AAP85846.1 HoxI [Cupriavidus necator H16]QCC05352.1 cyclic nucleotide-binding domain-containing protein [Cupriavidus necator H16]QQB81523.1 cyclic nucleotide-binding domain-containing protein [Cupriavidus necator]CAA63576.1 orf2 [Cupriavidus necator H16]